MHKKAQVVIAVCADNEWYLLRLQMNERRKGLWQNVTGSVEEGESFKQGAMRELWEETGLKIDEDAMIDLDLEMNFSDQYGRSVQERCFVAKVIGEKLPEITLDPNEHQAFEYVKWGDVSLETYSFSGHFESFQKASHFVGGP